MADFHFWMTGLWILLVIPTVFILRQSVFWVSLMSIYAIIVTHWTGFSAAKGEQEVHELAEKAIPESRSGDSSGPSHS